MGHKIKRMKMLVMSIIPHSHCELTVAKKHTTEPVELLTGSSETDTERRICLLWSLALCPFIETQVYR